MSMSKRHSRGHTRSYFGEFDAKPLIDWLNQKKRPAKDPVEKLVMLHGRIGDAATLVLGQDAAEEIQETVAAVVRRFKVAVAPVIGQVNVGGWEVDWRLVGRMPPLQGLAFIKLLQLAQKGLADRVRKCAWQECSQWFFARFSHQECCSARCQQKRVRASDEWKKNRREYMQRLRAEQKQRERRQDAIFKSKRKSKGARS